MKIHATTIVGVISLPVNLFRLGATRPIQGNRAIVSDSAVAAIRSSSESSLTIVVSSSEIKRTYIIHVDNAGSGVTEIRTREIVYKNDVLITGVWFFYSLTSSIRGPKS